MFFLLDDKNISYTLCVTNLFKFFGQTLDIYTHDCTYFKIDGVFLNILNIIRLII